MDEAREEQPDALAASGWLARLEGQGAEGIARAGNALKAVRFAAGRAAELGCGIAGVASAMPDRIALSALPARAMPSAPWLSRRASHKEAGRS